MPKSPDGKLSSPRLCLKFHRDHFGNSYHKSRDSTEPQYKSYSVTNMSVESNIDNPMFSPSDSPASSVDSDLYNPGLDNFTNFAGTRLKLSLVDDENAQPSLIPNVNMSTLRMDTNSMACVKEVFPDTANDLSEQITDQGGINSGIGDSEGNKAVLKAAETMPFKLSTNWNSNSNADSADELPDLEIDMTDSIPSKNSKPSNLSDIVPECNSVTSTSSRSPGQFGINHSSVTSTTEPPEQTKSDPLNTDKCLVNSDITSNSVESSHPCNEQSDTVDTCTSEAVNCSTNTSTELSTTLMCTKSDDQPTSVMANGEDTDTSENIPAPCSPSRSDRDSKDSRPSTPKVPPLKIIIPPKSQTTTSTTDTNDRLKPVTKSALPYVINPYQGVGREGTNQSEDVDTGLSQCMNQDVQTSVSESVSDLDLANNVDSAGNTNELKVKESESDHSSDVNVEMDVNSSEDLGVKSQDKKVNEKEDNKSDSETKKEDNKRDEPPQRVLRSTVRSQQQLVETKAPKPAKQEKLDRNSKYPFPNQGFTTPFLRCSFIGA